ncbi:MAG: C26 family cysteine hydrolase domain-containing family [Calothrix sp. SM1_5_4]|nr:C26 family cysteine hydrolase domain-containing family [Calothrix sp. SM1_5_4]
MSHLTSRGARLHLRDMRNLMVIQHVAHEPLGVLNPMLKAAGFRIKYVNFGRHPDLCPSLDGYNGLVVLGGPMGVYEVDRFPHLKVEMALIEEALRRDIPVLGICLGSQMLAHVLGARVRRGERPEIGWCEVRLTGADVMTSCSGASVRPSEFFSSIRIISTCHLEASIWLGRLCARARPSAMDAKLTVFSSISRSTRP